MKEGEGEGCPRVGLCLPDLIFFSVSFLCFLFEKKGGGKGRRTGEKDHVWEQNDREQTEKKIIET